MTEQNDPITAYDERGREILIDRETWRRDVLPDNLAKVWNDPEALYQIILGAIRDKFAPDIQEAAERLSDIDSNPERAACIHAIALMEVQRYDEAQSRLDDFISRHGETGVVLTNLAKTFSFRGQEFLAQPLLRRALTLDPNQENALHWWMAIHEDQGGQEAMRTALLEIDAEPGSWRAKLELARLALKENDLGQALALYRKVLEIERHPDAFYMISGDLGQAGYIAEMVELIEPLYELEHHDIPCGLNLVRAYAALGRIEPGRQLWRRLKALNLPGFDEVLAELEGLLLKPQPLTSAPEEAPQPIELSFPNVEGPIWTRGLADAAWLLDGRRSGIRVQMMPLTLAPPEMQMEPHEEIEDDEGRLSRAIPLFLADTLCFFTDAAADAGFPFVKDKGPAVTPAPWPLAEMLPGFGEGGADWLVLSGRMPTGKGFAARLEIDIWNGASGQLLTTVKQIARNGADQAALSLAEKVLAAVIETGLVAKCQPPAWYAPPTEDRISPWLLSLGQCLAQQFALNKMLPAEKLWNEHGIFETHFRLAEDNPDWVPPAILAVSSALAGLGYGSPVVGRYKKALEDLLKRHAGSFDPVDRLSPLAYLRLGDSGACQIARDRLSAIDSPSYRKWLEQVA
ncbi:MAG: hypothetical protein HQL45_04650 [Alphaproteobacteria bacterium]|nr:hypothetical protein [Alphaproteobacteria bacterium]